MAQPTETPSAPQTMPDAPPPLPESQATSATSVALYATVLVVVLIGLPLLGYKAIERSITRVPTQAPPTTPAPALAQPPAFATEPAAPEPDTDRLYIEDTEKRLLKSGDAIKEVVYTLPPGSMPHFADSAWCHRLDEVLMDLSDEGNLLMQMPITVSVGEKVTFSPAVERLHKKRKALGNELVGYTFDLRGSMPLLTEPDDQPLNPEKYRAATQRFKKAVRLYEETTVELVKARANQ